MADKSSHRASGSAVISRCNKYRYLLTRHIGGSSAVVTFIMLNPSTADGERDDPTIRRCIGFARRWRFGELRVVNLFAYRAARPETLRKVIDPIGPENARYLRHAVRNARVVCAWGVAGALREQNLVMMELLARHRVRPLALGITRDGHPWHPLYVSYSRAPFTYPMRRGTANRQR